MCSHASVLIRLLGVVYSSVVVLPSTPSIFTKGSSVLGSRSLMSNIWSLVRVGVFNNVSVVEINAEAASWLNKPLFLCFSML